MKKIQQILVALGVMLSFNASSQTVNLTYVTDSSGIGTGYCSVPIVIGVSAWGEVTGYNPATDSIDVRYFWDDGTDTVVRTNIYSFTTDNFYGYGTHTYTSPGIYNVMVTATGPGGIADTILNAPIYVTSGCTTVDGYCYFDNNANCIFDSGDDTLAGVPMEIKDAGGYTIGYAFANSSGYYHCDVPTGLSGLQIAPAPYWAPATVTSTCPMSGAYTFNSSGPNSLDFGFDCSGTAYDLAVIPSGIRVNSPGLDGWVNLTAANFSCLTTAATITLTLDPQVSYVSTTYGPAPSSVVGNVLTWNSSIVGSFYWYGSFWVGIKINTNISAVVFDTACFTASISPTADLDPSNNTINFCQIIGGPYDPNNKEVSPAGLGATGDIAPNTELNYLVNFQNTGTASAINVHINDTISSNLDMSTFQVLASSHPMTPYIYEGKYVRFDFPNIMLPDSNANEPLSHGWVKYKVKTKPGLVNGTQIKNTAHIFFDYNPAIVTNTTLNTINISLGIEEQSGGLMTLVYPNPAQDKFTVEFENEVEGLLSIVDATGRVVKIIPVNKTKTLSVTTSDLSSGLYGLSLPGIKLNQNRIQIIK